jgi:hypothetical protein
MKITEARIRQVIKEEIRKVLMEQQEHDQKYSVEERFLDRIILSDKMKELVNNGTIPEPVIKSPTSKLYYPFNNSRTNTVDFMSYRQGKNNKELYKAFAVPKNYIVQGSKLNSYGDQN